MSRPHVETAEPADEVTLAPLAEVGVDAVADAAMAGASPSEVMPPELEGRVAGAQPGWDDDLRARYCRWLTARDAPADRRTFGVLRGGSVVGTIRLDEIDRTKVRAELRSDQDGAARFGVTGAWLVDSVRGLGVGAAALSLVVQEAAALGLSAVLADTTVTNSRARGVLRRHDAVTHVSGDDVHARIPVVQRRDVGPCPC